MISQGVWLMLVGMTTVISFLTLMVATMHATAWAIERWSPAPAPAITPMPPPQPATSARDEEAIAAVLAAVEIWTRQNTGD